jgi:hypothetical protein
MDSRKQRQAISFFAGILFLTKDHMKNSKQMNEKDLLIARLYGCMGLLKPALLCIGNVHFEGSP